MWVRREAWRQSNSVWTTHPCPYQHLGIFQYKQWCVYECLTTSSPEKRKALFFSICQFLWYKIFHHVWFPATDRTSLNKLLGQEAHNWLSQAGVSQLQHTTEKETETHLSMGTVPKNFQSFGFSFHTLPSGCRWFTFLWHARASLIPSQYQT